MVGAVDQKNHAGPFVVAGQCILSFPCVKSRLIHGIKRTLDSQRSSLSLQLYLISRLCRGSALWSGCYLLSVLVIKPLHYFCCYGDRWSYFSLCLSL